VENCGVRIRSSNQEIIDRGGGFPRPTNPSEPRRRHGPERLSWPISEPGTSPRPDALPAVIPTPHPNASSRLEQSSPIACYVPKHSNGKTIRSRLEHTIVRHLCDTDAKPLRKHSSSSTIPANGETVVSRRGCSSQFLARPDRRPRPPRSRSCSYGEQQQRRGAPTPGCAPQPRLLRPQLVIRRQGRSHRAPRADPDDRLRAGARRRRGRAVMSHSAPPSIVTRTKPSQDATSPSNSRARWTRAAAGRSSPASTGRHYKVRTLACTVAARPPHNRT